MQMHRLLAVSWLSLSLFLSLSGAVRADGKAPLDPLIGEWNVGPPDGSAAFVQRFSFGPKQAYVWIAVSLIQPAGDEHPHFEGLAAWNAEKKRYDYLFAVEPGSGVQERGEIYAGDDGTIVREVLLTRADGTTEEFRQSFRDLGDGRFETALMQRTADGWVPTFPGSERLIMVRRAP